MVALAAALLVQLVVLYWPSVGVAGPVSWTDKVVHVLVFAVPAMLVRRLLPHQIWPVLMLAAHAPVSELVQHLLLPGRSGDGGDAVTDLAGIALGVAAARWWGSRSRRSEAPTPPW